MICNALFLYSMESDAENGKEDTAMKKGKTRLLLAVLSVVVAIIAATMFACSDNKKPSGEGESDSVNAGVYYYDTDEGETYYLTFSGKQNVIMSIKGETATGTYTLKDGTFEFALDKEATVTATYADSVISLVYNGSAMRFLRVESYTVTFDSAGGSGVDAVKITNGKTVSRPADPVRDGYAFVGWYTDSEYKTAFGFDSVPVYGDTTLYARWSDKLSGKTEYDVKYDLNYDGAANAYDSVRTVGGKVYNAPVPTREGYTFRGWWVSDYDKADKLTYRYDENNFEFNADTTLFAVWEDNSQSGISMPMPRVVGDSVQWDAIEGASIYDVEVVGPNGERIVNRSVGATTVDAKFSESAAGEYTITVRAVAPVESNSSATARRYYNNKGLARVSQFKVIEPRVLLYSSVDGAENYRISVVCANPEHNHEDFNNGTSTFFNFAGCEMTEKGIGFTVTATATGKGASVSTTYWYNKVLGKIEGLYIDDATETVRWSAVEGAVDYAVTIVADRTYVVYTGGATSVSIKNYPANSIKVSVVPKTSGYNSPAAAEYTYTRSGLKAPTGLKVTTNVISWDAVDGASAYTLYFAGKEYTGITATEYDISDIPLVYDTDYEIKVRVSGSKSSVWSDSVYAQYLTMSSAVKYSSNKVSWNPVIGATGYKVSVNGGTPVTVDAGKNSCDIEFERSGSNTISVQYVAGTAANPVWESVNVTVYEVEFVEREGTAVANKYFAQGDIVTLPESTRDGYILDGWYNVPGAAAANGQKLENGSRYSAGGNIILYAGWAARPYIVTTVVSDSESISSNNVTVKYNNNYKFDVPTQSDTSKTFVGWFTEEDGEGTQLTDSEGYSLAPWSDMSDKTVYSRWVKLFTFVLNTDGEYADTYSLQGVTGDISGVSKIVIPETYNGKDVTIIEGYSLNGSTTLKTIEIPDTVKLIYNDTAFEDCSALEEVNVYTTGHTLSPLYSSAGGVLYYTSEVAEEGKSLIFVPTAKTGHYAIPSDVKAISQNSFTGSRLTSVNIPSSVNTIAAYAFYESELSDINFDYDEGATLTVGEKAFGKCENLTSMKLPARFENFDPSMVSDSASFDTIEVADDHATYSSVDGMLCNKAGNTILYCPPAKRSEPKMPAGITTIGENAFAGCTKITSVTIPFYVTSVKSGAFRGCTALTKVTFSSGGTLVSSYETSVASDAFRGCTALTNVVFTANSNVVSFGANAFNGCTQMASFKFPKTVRTFPSSIFAGCSNLSTIEVDAENEYYSAQDNVIFNKAKTELIVYSLNLTAATYTVPSSVTKIASSVFANNTMLKSIIIDKNIVTIGDKAFSTSAIEKVIFVDGGSGELTIDENAFENCQSLVGVYVADSVANAQSGTYDLGTPSHLRVIGKQAFTRSAIRNVVISEGVDEIGIQAFYMCNNLKNISLPASLVTICESAFDWSGAITSVTIAQNSKLDSIGNRAFGRAEYLASFVVPASVTYIGDGAFGNFGVGSLMEENTMPAFTFAPRGTDGKRITLGAGVFSGSGIMSLSFPANLTTLTYEVDKWGYLNTTFDGAMFLLGEIANMPENDKYEFSGGMMFEKEDGVITILHSAICYNGIVIFDVPYEVPNTVRLVKEGAFSRAMGFVEFELDEDAGEDEELVDLILENSVFNNSYVTGVSFPARLKKLGDAEIEKVYGSMETQGMFEYSYILGSVTFEDTEDHPSRLGYIPDKCFARAYDPDMVEEMEDMVETQEFTEIVIPGSVKRIGRNAFQEVFTLERVTFNEGLEYIGNMAFGSDDGEGLENITEIDIPSTVKYIGELAFASAANLETVTFAAGSRLEVIGSGAFGFTGITSISLPSTFAGSSYVPSQSDANVMVPDGKLGDYMFSMCTNLESVTFEGGCPNIKEYGDAVFYGCTRYANIEFPVNLGKVGEWGEGGEIKTINIPKAFTFEQFLGFVPSMSGVTQFSLQGGKNNDGTLFYMEGDNSGAVYGKTKRYPTDKEPDMLVLLFYPATCADESYEVAEGTEVIYPNAFRGNKHLKHVTLPVGLKEIGECAFGVSTYTSSTELVSINIPYTVEIIRKNAFFGCTKLTTVTFDENVPTDKNGNPNPKYDPEFDRKTALTTIGQAAFRGCTSLSRIELPDTVSALGVEVQNIMPTIPTFHAATFYGCTSLEYVKLPVEVKNLLNLVFAKCTSLTDVVIPDGSKLQTINPYAFTETGLEEIDLSGATNLNTIDDHAFYNSGSLSSVTFGDRGQLTIGDYAFCGTAIEELDITKNITSIGAYAFYNVDGLNEVNVAEGSALTTIGEGAFYGAQIASFDFAEAASLKTIGDYAFYNGALTAIELPDSVTSVGDYAFYGNAGVTTFNMSSAIKHIGNFAFAGLNQITSVRIYGNNTTVGDSAFEDCTNLSDVTIDENVTSVGSRAFAFTAVTSIALPSTVASVTGNIAAGQTLSDFTSSTSLKVNTVGEDETQKVESVTNAEGTILYYVSPETTEYTIPDTVTEIKPGAFAGTAITSITLPISISVIPDGAFRGCTSLGSIEIKNVVTKIGDSAFEGCTSLSSVTFEAGGTVALSIGARAFAGCTALTEIEFPRRLRDDLGVKVETEIWDFPGLDEPYIYENYMITRKSGIGKSAFEGSGLETVTCEDTADSPDIYTGDYENEMLQIGEAAFRNCKSLTTFDFGNFKYLANGDDYDDVSNDGHMISKYAFQGCSMLSEFSFPESISTYRNNCNIDSYAFDGCSALKSFTVQSYMRNFLPYSFANSGLTSFEIPRKYGAVKFYIGDYAFANCTDLETFEFYGQWQTYWDESDLSHPMLGEYAFKGCTSLKTVVLNDVHSILEGAFAGLTGLESVTINFSNKNMVCYYTEEKQIIGENAFRGCTGLTTLTINGYIDNICAGAFANCTSVSEFVLTSSVTSISPSAFAGWTADQNIKVSFKDAASLPSGYSVGWFGNANIVYTTA